jgi:PhnB protein
MTTEAKPIPEGYHTITPTLTVSDCARALDFYKKAFGAQERMRADGPGGKVWHAEITIGDSIVMVNDEFPEQGAVAPSTIGGSPVGLWVYTDDVDAAYERAVEAAATTDMEPDDMFWGDRLCALRDPYGHKWTLATHVEDVSPEDMEKRQKAAMEQWASA